MTTDRDAFSGDPELRRVLRAALAQRFDDVDWDRLHGGIMAAAAHRAETGGRAWECVARWSARGVPAAAAALVAAVVILWIMPAGRATADPGPPGFWPVAEELLANLPEETRRLLGAGADDETMLRAVLADGGRERGAR
jgi:hypothetical protein